MGISSQTPYFRIGNDGEMWIEQKGLIIMIIYINQPNYERAINPVFLIWIAFLAREYGENFAWK